MAWSGGTYTKGNAATGGWTGDQSLGIGIEASRHDTQDNDFATGINQCLNKDGSNTPTANLNIGTYRLTSVGAATARTDAPQAAQVQDGDFIWLGTTAGTATAQTATAPLTMTAYKTGQKFRMKIGAGLGSTGSTATAHTININSIGAKNIVNNEDATNPTLGTWVAGAIMEVVYDGTNFVIINDPGGILTWTPTITPGSGMSVSSTSIKEARYRKKGKEVTFWLNVTFTLSGTPGLDVYFNVPTSTSGVSNAFILPCWILGQSSSLDPRWGQASTTTDTFQVTFINYASWVMSTGRQIVCTGTYRSV